MKKEQLEISDLTIEDLISSTALINQKIDAHPSELAKLKIKIEALTSKKQSLILENRHEQQKLYQAK